jgi:hypothetical protein
MALLDSALYFFGPLFFLVNGNLSGFFSSSCSLRQRDPLLQLLMGIFLRLF